jgi:hypothetical protein
VPVLFWTLSESDQSPGTALPVGDKTGGCVQVRETLARMRGVPAPDKQGQPEEEDDDDDEGKRLVTPIRRLHIAFNMLAAGRICLAYSFQAVLTPAPPLSAGPKRRPRRRSRQRSSEKGEGAGAEGVSFEGAEGGGLLVRLGRAAGGPATSLQPGDILVHEDYG